MIRVFCACGRAFKAEDRHAGKHTNCPECGASLTIGPAPEASSSGGDADEVPAWWYPRDPAAQAARGTAPTRSGSGPDPEDVSTQVLPPGYHSQAKPQASGQPPRTAAPTQAQVSRPKAPVEAELQAPAHPSVRTKNLWVISSGVIIFLVLAVGAIVWLRSSTPAVDDLRPVLQGTDAAKPDASGPGLPAAPSMPSRNPKPSENGIAKASTNDASADSSSSGPQVDSATQPKIAPASAFRRLRLLVPAYIYPGDDGRKEWQRLFAAASKAEIVAIANPNSGPGDERNIDYAAIFTEAINQGITLVGYVSTDYGKRPQSEIKKDVDSWIRFYPQIRGYFFDQQPRERQHAAHFAELRDYVKRKLKDPLVITNPGVSCDEAYLAQDVSNVTCVFVNYEGFQRFEIPTTLKGYAPSRFAAMPYNISDIEMMRTLVKDAIIKGIGYIYISDAKPPNQWGKLPAYWEAEVDAVSHLR
jgi:hypothetical protein